MSVPGRRC